MGKTSTDDIHAKYNECISLLDKSKVIQISSDGSNVNLTFLNFGKESRREDPLDVLIDIETFSLQNLHCSVQTGERATDWHIKQLLSSMYKIVDESPSCRADYAWIIAAIPSNRSLKFCSYAGLKMQLLLNELNPSGRRALKSIFGKHYLNPNNLGRENLYKISAMTVWPRVLMIQQYIWSCPFFKKSPK